MPMQPTIEDIRARYRHPRTKREDTASRDAYCVGGALCLTYGGAYHDDRFPDEDRLAEVLQRYNPALDDVWAYTIAADIINANDAGCFEEAWQYVEEALR